jgi:hypothetical protein
MLQPFVENALRHGMRQQPQLRVGGPRPGEPPPSIPRDAATARKSALRTRLGNAWLEKVSDEQYHSEPT